MAKSTQEVLDQAVIDIAAMDDVVDSAMALMDTLTGIIKANKTNPAALDAALAVFEAKKQALADSVVTNTQPAEPTP